VDDAVVDQEVLAEPLAGNVAVHGGGPACAQSGGSRISM
jgi:hypothetical protein